MSSTARARWAENTNASKIGRRKRAGRGLVLVLRKELNGIFERASREISANPRGNVARAKGSGQLLRGTPLSALRQAPAAFLRQDFFDSRTKINFRFFLVASWRRF
jgi:hypothetical protein